MTKDSKYFVGIESGGLNLFDVDRYVKQTREPFPLSDHKSVSVGGLIHYDLKDKLNLWPRLPNRLDSVTSGIVSPLREMFKILFLVKGLTLWGGTICYLEEVSVIYLCFATTLNKYVELKTYYEASQNPHWVEAMNLETKDLHRNNTWVLFDLLMGRKPIGYKWIYKIKYKSTGESCYKDGHVKCLSSLAVDNNWLLFQSNVNNIFLYGDINEEVYMSLPPGFMIRMRKKITEYVKSKKGQFIALLAYVDDIVIIGANPDFHEKPKHFELDVLLVREKVSSGVIKTMKVSSACRYIYQSCDYSSQFWQLVKKKVEVVNNGKDWSTIVNGFATMKNGNSIRSMIRRLCLAASIYLIWQERNARLFKDEKRNVDDLFKNLVEIVTLRLSSLKVKRSKEVHKIEDSWNVKLNTSTA
ncbi:ribonuclease H-like domain-containing protein [Tanacetum coccineum]